MRGGSRQLHVIGEGQQRLAQLVMHGHSMNAIKVSAVGHQSGLARARHIKAAEHKRCACGTLE